jgi:F0F1-type ATP synthase membrane subunit a
MASVVKSIIEGVKEKGLGGFFRHLKNEGYLFVPFLFQLILFPIIQFHKSQYLSF